MESEKFLRFRQDFIKSPKRALASFSMFSSKGKKTSLKLQQSIENESCNYDKLLLWLDELAHFSSFELDFSRFPKTLGFYGSEDNITSALNGEYFKSKISDSEITIFKDAAHDLHLTHAQEMAAQIIKSLT